MVTDECRKDCKKCFYCRAQIVGGNPELRCFKADHIKGVRLEWRCVQPNWCPNLNPKEDGFSRMYTVPEVAEILKDDPGHVYAMCRSGILPSVRMGRNVRVAEDKLKAWIRCGGRTCDYNNEDGQSQPFGEEVMR